MSKPTKTGYCRTHDFAPYTRADGQAVSDEFDAVQAHLDRLPELRDDGLGFKVSPVIPEPTQDNHPATYGQLKNAETSVLQSVDLAQKWAANPEDSMVQNGQFSALHYANKARAAKNSAEEAQSLAENAKTQAQHSATEANQAKEAAANSAQEAQRSATSIAGVESRVNQMNEQAQAINIEVNSLKTSIEQAQQQAQQSAEQAQQAASQARNIAGGRKEWSDIDNVPISSEVDNSSTTDLANSFAVKIAYDKAVEAKTSADNAQQSANNAQTAANNANNNANGRVSKSGDTMTGLLTIDMPASYILGKDGSKNKWWFGRGDADSDDITLMANAVRNKLTLKADRTESEKPLFVKQHQVYHPGHFPRAAENNYGFVKISHKTNGTDKTKAASEYALGQLASNLNQNQGFTQNLREVGWTKLPNGLILQWSSLTYIYSGQRINFPISFTNQCFFVAITPFGDDHSISATIGLEGVRNGYFFAKSRAAGISYFAVGY